MKTSIIKKHSAALAVLAGVFALALVGCGSNATPKGSTSPSGPGDPQTPAVTPPANMSEPKVKYIFFEPKSEKDLQTETNYGYLIAKAKPGFNPLKFDKLGLKVASSFTAGGATYYHLHKEGGNVLETLNAAKTMPGLMFVEPDIMYHTTQLAPDPIDYNNPDPLVLTTQYGVRVTSTVDAWKTYGFGPNRPVVVDVDTGVAYNNSELRNIVKHAFTWYATDGSTLLPNGNPYADPDPDDSLITNGAATNGNDGQGHGSHTAGTIGAEGNNGVTVAGMCWNVDLVCYKGLSDAGSGGSWEVYGSIWHLARWKKTNYPHTIPVNMSLGSHWASQFAIDVVNLGLENNIVICASAGNSYAGAVSFPGSLTGTIRVGASDQLNRMANFSDYGPDMSVMAPGVAILSTGRGNASATASMSGTSMAAPHVTGLVGYMLTFAPDLTPDQIKTYLEQNADPVDGQIGFMPQYGYGVINTLKTIGAVIDDVNAGRTAPSNYVLSPIKITVGNRMGSVVSPLNNTNVYLYHCTADGSIQNYVATSITGTTFHDLREDPTVDTEDGVAWFSMLKPGYYRAAASSFYYNVQAGDFEYYGKYSPVFEVKAGQTVAPQEIIFEIDLLFVQTYPTQNQTNGINANYPSIDTMLGLYDSSGNLLYEYDYDSFDTMAVIPPPPGTYRVSVEPYIAAIAGGLLGLFSSYVELGGEYALCVSHGMQPSPAPLEWATAGAMQGSQARNTPNSPQPINFGDVYYGLMTSRSGLAGTLSNGTRPSPPNIDYYEVAIPASPGPAPIY